MKLLVFANGFSAFNGGISSYGIVPEDWNSSRRERPEVVERLQGLVPRIQEMSRRQLGANFLSAGFDGGEQLWLNVKPGTSRNNETKFQFRDLIGWIALCDCE